MNFEHFRVIERVSNFPESFTFHFSNRPEDSIEWRWSVRLFNKYVNTSTLTHQHANTSTHQQDTSGKTFESYGTRQKMFVLSSVFFSRKGFSVEFVSFPTTNPHLSNSYTSTHQHVNTGIERDNKHMNTVLNTIPTQYQHINTTIIQSSTHQHNHQHINLHNVINKCHQHSSISTHTNRTRQRRLSFFLCFFSKRFFLLSLSLPLQF
jgi:hypothetical protein